MVTAVPPALSYCVVNTNGREDLLACLDAIERTHPDGVEREILVRALEHHRFNRTAAGISLGLSLRQMRYRMARLNVNVGGDSGGVDRE